MYLEIIRNVRLPKDMESTPEEDENNYLSLAQTSMNCEVVISFLATVCRKGVWVLIPYYAASVTSGYVHY